ncbi:fumarylacetoacetase [Rhodococcus sp. IEGM 1401]|uniref:fumarylacetoacetase n=1 Tax=unclassified Rhodococcus (in: high G+C Gram-positive bacteria) TaxID=192944 RepID=UPI0022B33892|nr:MULTISPECIES: fumarylacetoacetase [unclassified Rhodococcus (in: high G+C Gram-positive bacteria)]MCZ4563771.1 fumarylacetoacetase [Rhodococcus sp. IEGM 1401]MDI9923907.1 fumarylacetoacetase [Rhodococcus sp. IEGM 1372]MDI9926793.1 fumarylacetoacetase [Rhodococcus sp. IEGM 1341]MDV8036386.1 fumarylacetoacetase [Rhodococcus sp. IEGM 1414]
MTHIDIPADSEFGIDNLPYGIFSTPGTNARVGVRYGDNVIDLYGALGDADFASTSLNAFMARGRSRWAEIRSSVTDMLAGGTTPAEAIVPVSDVTMHLPFEVADYVDFYASEHHAANLGRLFRPDAEPLLPNWKHLPVAYHGRSGTVVVSGTDITRPRGQRKAPDEASPTFGPSRRLDIEAEMGFVVGVPSDGPISPDRFSDHVFGAVIVNDWSARDIQAWEYVPLGPNLGKSFATSISPWVVPLLALEHARTSTPVQDPEPLDYLRESRSWALDIDLTVAWNGHVVSHPPYTAMYWSPAQMLAHETVNGATSRTGDLFASGTISGPEKNQRGAFIELTWGGKEPVTLGSETRTFLKDGDEISIAASAPGPNGSRIGFGDVRGRIKPA